jgi:hypothetical protein
LGFDSRRRHTRTHPHIYISLNYTRRKFIFSVCKTVGTRTRRYDDDGGNQNEFRLFPLWFSMHLYRIINNMIVACVVYYNIIYLRQRCRISRLLCRSHPKCGNNCIVLSHIYRYLLYNLVYILLPIYVREHDNRWR